MKPRKITHREFERTIRAGEKPASMRGELYYRVLKLIDAGFITEAHLLFLATWNFAAFRYVVPTFNLRDFEKRLNSVTPNLQPLASSDIATVNLSDHRKLIIGVFNRFAAVKGIKFTGASKVLHLLLPRIFIMWDAAIAGWHTPKSDYANLAIVRSGFWKPPVYPFPRSGAGYYAFLVYCQSRFNPFVSPSSDETLAKYIDEFNHCTIYKCLPRR